MISGLVVHLSLDANLAATAIEALRSDPAIQLGERFGCRLPLILDTQGSEAAQLKTDLLLSIPGVVHVDVTFVHFEEQADVSGEVNHAHG